MILNKDMIKNPSITFIFLATLVAFPLITQATAYHAKKCEQPAKKLKANKTLINKDFEGNDAISCQEIQGVTHMVGDLADFLNLDLTGLDLYFLKNNEYFQNGWYNPLVPAIEYSIYDTNNLNEFDVLIHHEVGHHFDYEHPKMKKYRKNCTAHIPNFEKEKIYSKVFTVEGHPQLSKADECLKKTFENHVDTILTEMIADLAMALYLRKPLFTGPNTDMHGDSASFAPIESTQDIEELFTKDKLFLHGDNPYLATAPFRQFLGQKIDFKKISREKAKTLLFKLRDISFDLKLNYRKTASNKQLQDFTNSNNSWAGHGEVKIIGGKGETDVLDVQGLNEKLIEKTKLLFKEIRI